VLGGEPKVRPVCKFCCAEFPCCTISPCGEAFSLSKVASHQSAGQVIGARGILAFSSPAGKCSAPPTWNYSNYSLE